MLWPTSFSFFTVEMIFPITLHTYMTQFLLVLSICRQSIPFICL